MRRALISVLTMTALLTGLAGAGGPAQTGPDVSQKRTDPATKPTTAEPQDGKPPGVINVKDYGAVGDGETEDTQAIQNALDAASRVGATVVFPSGQYLTDTLRLYPHPANRFKTYGGVTLRGVEPVADAVDHNAGAGARIIHINESPANLLEAIGGRAGEAVRAVRIENLRLVGGDSTDNLIFLEAATENITLDTLFLRSRSNGNGIYLNRCRGVHLHRVRLDGPTPSRSEGTGVVMNNPVDPGAARPIRMDEVRVYGFGRDFRLAGVSGQSRTDIGPVISMPKPKH